MDLKFEKIVNHLIVSGFVYQGSQIYNGLANSWDFGPLGVELKNNIKQFWWKKFIKESIYNVGIDSSIIMNPEIWKVSGHLSNFSDPLMDCKSCKTRHRADKLVEDFNPNINPNSWTHQELKKFIDENKIKCPNCGKSDFTDIRKFQLMFKTYMGAIEDSTSEVYLRPETAQGIFVNFKNVQRSSRKKIPFGIGQIGKAFRNEITPGNFIFRVREFDQAELEFFCKPGEDQKWYEYWKNFCLNWLLSLNIKKENLRIREHEKEELSHYSKGTCDIEYKFPFGWGELWGIANRTDYDLKAHSNGSSENLDYLEPESNERYIPFCIEPSLGIERCFLTILTDSYCEEQVGDDSRIVLKMHPSIAPIKLAVFPLSKQLKDNAFGLYQQLVKEFACEYDESGSIGKRYRRQDAIGTPYCITYDFESVNDQKVTLRDRDSMEQIRISIDEIKEYVRKKIEI